MTMRDQGHGVFTRVQQGKFQVRTPFHDQFIVTAHILGGRWRKRAEFWSFRRDQYRRVAEELNRLFGTHLPIGDNNV